jgi:hypothetical protein
MSIPNVFFVQVPIIPEYLLRIQHPNNTEMLLHDRFDDLPPASSSAEFDGNRRKRQFEWDSADWDKLGEEEEDEDEGQIRRKVENE